MRGAAERIISDKARIARILIKWLKKRSILHPSCQFDCENIFNIDDVYAEENRSKSFVIIHMCFIRYKTTAIRS